MTYKTILAITLAVVLIGATNSATTVFAENDKDNAKSRTLSDFCAKLDDKNGFPALVCSAISVLQAEISHIQQTPGPAGPQGPAGATLPVRFYIVSAPATPVSGIPNQAFFGATASCNLGDAATGGGYISDPTFPDGVQIFHSAPSPPAGTPTGWEVDGHNISGGTKFVSVYAVCAHSGP
jgi:hypothetical protein